ncbi:16S rRNA (guanine(966)-N(2))-methyltransferase RsmD [Hahella sp. CCB-MM4]|uniref:16S rRNA (guanine(966)-N(2))-methyltransferase RsmD n=1 Tax=Hahella sp. (strain CCB-MM4) TaxID=1926491 RepID=UPI000B9B0513|nr:16S rRNA (guanine(966)-N(2))-methyltransferase RsmD [Hahella sp. CCB-MM4]OZG75130.1 16S rRNA (guanine(966)-N(2))-methyltransferase RsmD [Hahella sp. CCB-MM4]
MRKPNKPKTELGTLRIIGGRHRGRKLQFPVLEGVRPTPDRVRETLFNWLTAHLPGARCLDLFAGSGAIGLEAISRDATEVWFVDSAPAVVDTLKSHLKTLREDNAQIFLDDAIAWLKKHRPDVPFDIVFLDPPFYKGWLTDACKLLESNGFLKSGSHIYIEAESSLSTLPLPPNWHVIRQKQAGQVQYSLCIRD